MMIVDTHVHVVSDDRKRYPQVRDTERAAQVPTYADLGQEEWPALTAERLVEMMDRCEVDKALLVQTYYTYQYDNSYATDSAAAYPDRFLAVCVLDPLSPTSPDEPSRLVEEENVCGLRLQYGRRKFCYLDNPDTFPLWERAASLKIPVCIADRLDNLPRMRAVLERFPEVPIAFDHIWGNVVGDPPYDLLQPLFALAPYRNVYIKTAVNNSFAARKGKSTPNVFYSTLIERFGANRIMWGSNYPAHPGKFGEFDKRVEIAKEDLAFLSNSDQAWIFGETALSLWPDLR